MFIFRILIPLFIAMLLGACENIPGGKRSLDVESPKGNLQFDSDTRKCGENMECKKGEKDEGEGGP